MKWLRVNQVTAFCFSGDFAKTREAKREEKEAFLSEFLGSPHCPDLGLNHSVFVVAQRLHGARNQSTGRDGDKLELGKHSGLLGGSAVSQVEYGLFHTRDIGPAL